MHHHLDPDKPVHIETDENYTYLTFQLQNILTMKQLNIYNHNCASMNIRKIAIISICFI